MRSLFTDEKGVNNRDALHPSRKFFYDFFVPVVSSERLLTGSMTVTIPCKQAGGRPPTMMNAIARKSVGGLSPCLLAIPKNEVLAPARLTFILEGPAEWPEGWTKQICKQKNGATKGRKDCCWITPEKHFKLRSTVEVKKFLTALKATTMKTKEKPTN
jgi:hypothetical protein